MCVFFNWLLERMSRREYSYTLRGKCAYFCHLNPKFICRMTVKNRAPLPLLTLKVGFGPGQTRNKPLMYFAQKRETLFSVFGWIQSGSVCLEYSFSLE